MKIVGQETPKAQVQITLGHGSIDSSVSVDGVDCTKSIKAIRAECRAGRLTDVTLELAACVSGTTVEAHMNADHLRVLQPFILTAHGPLLALAAQWRDRASAEEATGQRLRTDGWPECEALPYDQCAVAYRSRANELAAVIDGLADCEARGEVIGR